VTDIIADSRIVAAALTQSDGSKQKVAGSSIVADKRLVAGRLKNVCRDGPGRHGAEDSEQNDYEQEDYENEAYKKEDYEKEDERWTMTRRRK